MADGDIYRSDEIGQGAVEAMVEVTTKSGRKGYARAALAAGAGGGGDASAANQLATNTLLGAVTETAPASDTASSGLNGRLQRIAQRLTSLIALLPTSLGAKAVSASLSVASAGLQYATGASVSVAAFGKFT